MYASAVTGNNTLMTISIPILYEDNDVVVINKPAGLVVHPDGRTKEYTLVDWVRERYPSIAEAQVGEPIVQTSGEVIEKPGLVHRIDRETSGILLIAKTQESFLSLKAQFQARTIKKEYNAFVYGGFKESYGVIEKPIGRSASDFRRWSAEYGARGELREAKTEYWVLGEGVTQGKKISYLKVAPHTGRTHQIRVHLKAVGHPLLSDGLYAPKMPALLGFSRTALHASKITFKGLDGAERSVEAPLPEDFQSALAALEITAR